MRRGGRRPGSCRRGAGPRPRPRTPSPRPACLTQSALALDGSLRKRRGAGRPARTVLGYRGGGFSGCQRASRHPAWLRSAEVRTRVYRCPRPTSPHRSRTAGRCCGRESLPSALTTPDRLGSPSRKAALPGTSPHLGYLSSAMVSGLPTAVKEKADQRPFNPRPLPLRSSGGSGPETGSRSRLPSGTRRRSQRRRTAAGRSRLPDGTLLGSGPARQAGPTQPFRPLSNRRSLVPVCNKAGGRWLIQRVVSPSLESLRPAAANPAR